jgi:hypothetical protein
VYFEEEMSQEELLDQAPVADIHIRTIGHLFAGTSAVSLTWSLTSIGFYTWMNAIHPLVSIVTLSISATLFIVLYILMIAARRTNPDIAMGAFMGWALSGALVMGSCTALARSIAPVQLSLLLLNQSLSLVAYTKLSPREINSTHALLIVLGTGLFVWCCCVYSFIVDEQWRAGMVIFILGAISGVHCWYQLRAAANRYNLTWTDAQLSVIQFYGDPIKLCRK